MYNLLTAKTLAYTGHSIKGRDPSVIDDLVRYSRIAQTWINEQIGFLDDYKHNGALDDVTIDNARMSIETCQGYATAGQQEQVFREIAYLLRQCKKLAVTAPRDDLGRPSMPIARDVIAKLQQCSKLIDRINDIGFEWKDDMED